MTKSDVKKNYGLYARKWTVNYSKTLFCERKQREKIQNIPNIA